jgi:hypothetical protein
VQPAFEPGAGERGVGVPARGRVVGPDANERRHPTATRLVAVLGTPGPGMEAEL